MMIFFSVGEPSSDQHAAHLIHELRRRRPDVECVGYGGPLMEQAGCRLDYRLTNLAVMGVLAVLPLLWQFFQLMRRAARQFRESPPDAVVLLDFPGFNWWIARKAKQAGIPVFYYCPPQLWAWAAWRVRKMRRFVDHVLCCLPFEPEWYRQRGIEAEYVGHPFFDEVAEKHLDAAFVIEHKTATQKNGRRTIGILPGSRKSEVHGNWPIQLRVMEEIAQRFPRTKFLVACYKESQRDFCRAHFAAANLELDVEFCLGKTSEIIEVAELCLMVSGSVSLELLARKTPAVVLYRVDWLFYWIARALITCKWMSLPNLMAERTLMPEFVVVNNIEPTVAQASEILTGWLSDPAQLAERRRELAELHAQVIQTGATGRTAEAILRRFPAASPVAGARRAA